jgi:hypothetical protein
MQPKVVSMGTPYFTEEFKDETVKQVVEGGYPQKK